MKAIVVGRHSPDFGSEDIEIILQENINFPATSRETIPVVEVLIAKAVETGAALLFQNSPAQLTVALHRAIVEHQIGWKDQARSLPPIGIVVSIPGERPAGVRKMYKFATGNCGDEDFVEEAKDLAKFVNPRVKIEEEQYQGIWFEVDPPMRFVFSHIEWLNQS